MKSFVMMAAAALTAAAGGAFGSITPIDYTSVTANGGENFNTLPTSFVTQDSIMHGVGISFGKKLAGQTVGTASETIFGAAELFDTLSGSPTAPLTLEAGPAGHNLWTGVAGTPSVVLSTGGPNGVTFGPGGLGHGSIAFMFDSDVSQLGFLVGGQNGSTGVLNFFRRDGSLIDTVSISLSGVPGTYTPDLKFGFETSNGAAEIAAVTMTHNDFAGVYMDDFIFNASVPTPGAAGLFGVAAIAAGRRRRR
jgi:MYXO-CTERM domain-containing protein